MLIKFHHVAEEEPIYINSRHVSNIKMYKDNVSECWKIIITMIDGTGYCEWLEDSRENPLSDRKATERFQQIIYNWERSEIT